MSSGSHNVFVVFLVIFGGFTILLVQNSGMSIECIGICLLLKVLIVVIAEDLDCFLQKFLIMTTSSISNQIVH